MADTNTLTLRWEIVGCGLISSWFVLDLLLPRSSAPTKHIIQAIGSSSEEKGTEFVAKHASSAKPSVYASYKKVYNDQSVDIVYIGTPHSCHLQNALDAIKAGKNVLCEKPITMNAKELEILISAAKEKAVWTRFFPVAKALQNLLYIDKTMGDVSRVFVDFGLDMPIASLPPSSRSVNPALGAGALLDIGIYTLTWASIILQQQIEVPSMVSSMSFVGGADEMTSIIYNYPKSAIQAILTSSMRYKGGPDFCRIEGDKGSILVRGVATSKPGYLVIKLKGKEEKKIDFEIPGFGFYFEADAVAEDLRNGRKESETIPLNESMKVTRLMDDVRAQNNLRYKQDE